MTTKKKAKQAAAQVGQQVAGIMPDADRDDLQRQEARARQVAEAQAAAIVQAQADARAQQVAALQGLSSALDRESYGRLARIDPILAEGVQRAIWGGASPGAVGAVVRLRSRSDGLARMTEQAARHFAAVFGRVPEQTDPDPLAGILEALDARAWEDLQDRYPSMASALQAAVACGLPAATIRAHIADHSQNPDLAHYMDQAASHLARLMTPAQA